MSVADKLLTVAQNQQAVYEAGQKSEYDRFWDVYQEKGQRQNYSQGFYDWYPEIFRPKYDIRPVGDTQQLFRVFGVNDGGKMDLVQVLKDCGVVLDTSAVTDLPNCFAFAHIRTCPEINTLSMSTVSGVFANSYLDTVEKLILKEDGSQIFRNTFNNCVYIQNIVINGTIGQNGFNISSAAKLTHDSLMSIINALKDYSQDTSGTAHTVTLGTTNLNKLTDEEKAVATQKGWTLA